MKKDKEFKAKIERDPIRGVVEITVIGYFCGSRYSMEEITPCFASLEEAVAARPAIAISEEMEGFLWALRDALNEYWTTRHPHKIEIGSEPGELLTLERLSFLSKVGRCFK